MGVGAGFVGMRWKFQPYLGQRRITRPQFITYPKSGSRDHPTLGRVAKLAI